MRGLAGRDLSRVLTGDLWREGGHVKDGQLQICS